MNKKKLLMCLIVFSYKMDPDYPFILATNRDEFYERPTQAAHIWQTSPKIIAGKDKKAGGTWLGISETGRFAALTNYRKMDDIREDTTSRGIIVKDFLLSDVNPCDYLSELQREGDQYNGFNLIAGTFEELFYVSNRKDGVYKIKPGNHAVSNAFLNTPWPKTENTLERFQDILEDDGVDEERLFKMLLDDQRYPIEKLPDTGLPQETEQAVSSVFIQTENYGTRSSSLIVVDNDRDVQFSERSYIPGTKKTDQSVRFNIEV